jgi:hypothetical protein
MTPDRTEETGTGGWAMPLGRVGVRERAASGGTR